MAQKIAELEKQTTSDGFWNDADAARNQAFQVDARLMQALLCTYRGDHDEARAHLDEADAIANDARLHPAIVDARCLRAVCLWESGETAAARDLALSVIEDIDASPGLTRRADVWITLGLAARDCGDPHEAATAWKRARRIATDEDQPAHAATAAALVSLIDGEGRAAASAAFAEHGERMMVWDRIITLTALASEGDELSAALRNDVALVRAQVSPRRFETMPRTVRTIRAPPAALPTPLPPHASTAGFGPRNFGCAGRGCSGPGCRIGSKRCALRLEHAVRFTICG